MAVLAQLLSQQLVGFCLWRTCSIVFPNMALACSFAKLGPFPQLSFNSKEYLINSLNLTLATMDPLKSIPQP